MPWTPTTMATHIPILSALRRAGDLDVVGGLVDM